MFGLWKKLLVCFKRILNGHSMATSYINFTGKINEDISNKFMAACAAVAGLCAGVPALKRPAVEDRAESDLRLGFLGGYGRCLPRRPHRREARQEPRHDQSALHDILLVAGGKPGIAETDYRSAVGTLQGLVPDGRRPVG